MSRAFIQKIGAFTPLAVPGCVLWLDAADTSSMVMNGSTVSQWNDKSGRGYNMTQPTAGNQPTRAVGANGNTILTFTQSSSTVLSNTSFPALIGSGKATYFLVEYNMTAPTGNPGPFGYSSGPNFALIMQYNPGFTGGLQPFQSGVSSFTSATPRLDYLYKANDGTNMIGYINGNLQTVSDTSSGTYSGTFYVGFATNGYISGNICDLVVYTTALSTLQRQQVEGYLAQKWGFTASLPPGHPGLTQTFYTAGKNPGIAAVPSNIVTDVPYTNYFPLSIAGCTMWLDGADSSKVLLNGSTVSQWTDKSAAGNNATQPTAGNQPSYSASGIVFAGNQWLITPIDVNPTAESFFIVFKTTNNLAEIFSGTNVNGREVLVVSGVMYLSKYGTNPVGLTPNGGSVSTNTVTLFDYQYTTSLVTLNLNGLQTGSGAPPVTYSGTGTSYIGSSTYAPNNMYGTIYEIIYYNVSLTSNQRQSIEGYLAWKWGITLTNTHPYYTTPPLSFNRPTQVASIPLQLRIIPDPWTPLRPLSSGVLPWHWFRGDVGMTTTAWTNFGTSKSNASNVGTITLGNYTQGGSQAGGTNNTCTVSPSGYWNWPGVYQTSYHAIFGVFKLSASLTNGQTWTWKGNSYAGRGYTPQYRITNTSGVFTDDILSQGAFLPLNGVTIDPSTRFYTHSMVWGSTPAVSLLQVGTKIASPNGWTTDYGLGIYNDEYIGYAVAPAQPAGVTMTVCEILLFATNSGYGGPVDLTAQDILDVQSYLARKWGV